MVVTDARHRGEPIVWVNDAFIALTGYAREELHGRNCRMLQGPETDPEVVRGMREAIARGEPIECELCNYRKDGTPFWNGMTICPVRDADGTVIYHFAAQADLTEKRTLEAALKRANETLENQVSERTAALSFALEQKTALLHEVDHRVKNNLQVISSLMLLKARRTPPGEAREAIDAMAQRIGALSTAHRMLYSAGDLVRFDFREFTADFLADLALGVEGRVSVESEIEAMAISAAMAAPLALVMHELATNAVRHAFPGDRSGQICVSAKRGETGMVLSIEDDGAGLEAGDPNPAGFGRVLVEMMVRQLRGTLRYIDRGPGTRVEITIPLQHGEAA